LVVGALASNDNIENLSAPLTIEGRCNEQSTEQGNEHEHKRRIRAALEDSMSDNAPFVPQVARTEALSGRTSADLSLTTTTANIKPPRSQPCGMTAGV